MDENDDYTQIQRRLCAVMAKSEWTSSRMRMQKSGEELRESRAKSNRSANKFLQDLLDKRTDGDLTDDNGVVDRYNKFVKCKSALNDDTNSTLDEFNRRLRALQNNRRNQTNKLNNENLHVFIEQNSQTLINQSQSTIDIQTSNEDILSEVQNEERVKSSRVLPPISGVPITSTPNDTTNDLNTPIFQVDDIQELSNVQSENVSFIENNIDHNEVSLLERTQTLNSLSNSLEHSLQQTIYAPKACRSDGIEISPISSKSSLPRTSSNVALFNRCYFPRSLISRGNLNNTNSTLKRHLPSIPIVETIKQEQFDNNEIFYLLDNLDKKFQTNTNFDFTKMLDQLTLKTVIHQDETNDNQEETDENSSIENISLIMNSDENYPNLFHETSTLTKEKDFYTTICVNIDDLNNISLYTMTLSTVQLSTSLLLPYSMLNGRRPLLKCSKQTNFKPIHQKQQNITYSVTAIETSLDIEQIQQNDIILKINDQSLWGLTTDVIIDIFKQYTKRSQSCSLTIARLCQPFI